MSCALPCCCFSLFSATVGESDIFEWLWESCARFKQAVWSVKRPVSQWNLWSPCPTHFLQLCSWMSHDVLLQRWGELGFEENALNTFSQSSTREPKSGMTLLAIFFPIICIAVFLQVPDRCFALTRSLIEKNGECDRCFLVVYGRFMLFLVIFGLCSRLQFFKGYRNSGGFTNSTCWGHFEVESSPKERALLSELPTHRAPAQDKMSTAWKP